MLKVAVVLLTSLLVSLAGCASVASLHPLALPNDKDIVFDPALLGTWEEAESFGDGTKTTYTVSRADSGYSYSMVAGADQTNGTMRLIKAGGQYLLDIYSASNGAPLPVHVFLRLRLEKDTAWVAVMDSDWLQDQIKTRGELRHEVLREDDPRVVLTASPAELRQYLLPYASDDRTFGEEGELHRIALEGK